MYILVEYLILRNYWSLLILNIIILQLFVKSSFLLEAHVEVFMDEMILGSLLQSNPEHVCVYVEWGD